MSIAELKQGGRSVARGHNTPRAFYVERLTEGVATIAAAFWPEAGHRAPVGLQVERVPQADRRCPLRARGREPDARLSRCVALHLGRFRECFEMECQAMKRVRDDMGLTNVELMVPFVRTVREATGRRPDREERPVARQRRQAGRQRVACGSS
jgi:pyruvate,water dikinase